MTTKFYLFFEDGTWSIMEGDMLGTTYRDLVNKYPYLASKDVRQITSEDYLSDKQRLHVSKEELKAKTGPQLSIVK